MRALICHGLTFSADICVQLYKESQYQRYQRKDQTELLASKKQYHDQNTKAERSVVFRTDRNKLKKDNMIH